MLVKQFNNRQSIFTLGGNQTVQDIRMIAWIISISTQVCIRLKMLSTVWVGVVQMDTYTQPGAMLGVVIQIIVLTTGLSKFFIVDNIGINNVLITLGICLMLFILGEVVKPLYAKIFKDYTEVKK